MIQKNQSSLENLIQELPSKKEEAWKYTSLSQFKKIQWTTPSTDDEQLTHDQMQQLSKNLPSYFYNLVFVNGFLNKTLSDDLSDDIQVLKTQPADFEKNENHVEARLINLANSFLDKKISIQIQKSKTFEKPLQILFVQNSKNSVYVSQKIDVQVGENSELNLILNSISFENSTADALNLNARLTLAESSRVKLIQLQNEDLDSYHFSQVEVILQSRSQFHSLVMSLGTALTRNYLHVDFAGQQASARVYGLTLLDSSQHVDHYTFIQHKLGENESVQHYKSILSGASQSVFRGRIRIEPQAQKAQSEQLNNNLLLTREASANSIPQLEIYADDVKAGHGSTTGQLSNDEIFYFLSRGINQFEAVKMLSFGYAQELIYKFENSDVQNFLLKALRQKLERMIQNV